MHKNTLHLVLTLAATVALTGCSGFNTASKTATPIGVSMQGLHGNVHGGQQPVGFASLQVYQAGTGYGTGATALITPNSYYAGGASGCVTGNGQTCYSGVVTDTNGNFSLTGDYHCTSGTQVYITASGGQPTPGTTNSAISLMVGVGLCDNIGPNTFLQINEVTTVAAVWTLAPFMPATPATLPANIGAPSTNATGLVNAFADINSLVNIPTGSANVSTTTTSIPTAEIYTIANILAACVNSTGVGSNGCNGLLNNAPNADSSTPTDTFSAALNIARNPTRNVMALIADQSSSPPFQPTVASANDFTLAITYSGSGISAPSAAAIDASGNVWIANTGSSSLTELSHTGSVLSGATGFTAGSISGPTAIAVDTVGNIWVANGTTSTLTELSSTGTNVNSSPFTGGGLSTPTSIAFDGLGNLWATNSGNSAVSEFSSNGIALSGTTGYTVSGVNAPVGIAINPK
jgi:hypothetical protein